jgi:hypothetical protein
MMMASKMDLQVYFQVVYLIPDIFVQLQYLIIETDYKIIIPQFAPSKGEATECIIFYCVDSWCARRSRTDGL